MSENRRLGPGSAGAVWDDSSEQDITRAVLDLKERAMARDETPFTDVVFDKMTFDLFCRLPGVPAVPRRLPDALSGLRVHVRSSRDAAAQTGVELALAGFRVALCVEEAPRAPEDK